MRRFEGGSWRLSALAEGHVGASAMRQGFILADIARVAGELSDMMSGGLSWRRGDAFI